MRTFKFDIDLLNAKPEFDEVWLNKADLPDGPMPETGDVVKIYTDFDDDYVSFIVESVDNEKIFLE